MKTLLQILKERKLQLFFLLYVLMPVPVLSLLAQNLSLSAVAVGIGLSLLLLCVVFLLASFMTTRGLKIFYSLLLAVTIIPGTILIGYLFIGHVLLSGGTITSIFETNTDEASEFIAYLNPWLVTAVTLFVLTPIVMICRMKQPERFFRIRRHKYAFFALVFVALLFVTVRPVAQRIYFVDFYRVFAHYKIGRFREERALARRHTLPFEVRTQPDKTPRLVVLVIGESHARRHMSLYGYPRDTNPLLSARRGELSVYTDVVSPQVHTIPVLRAALTFADWDHPERLTTYPSLIELFNRAGFETYVISNQPLLDGSSSYDAFLKLADHTVDLSARKAPDGILLPPFEQALTAPSDRPKLIVLHLMGSHIGYKYRYPADFDFFTRLNDTLPNAQPDLTPEARTTVDEYDNSVRYNDYLLSTLIARIEREHTPAALIYFSDHGEEVNEFRPFNGHAYEKVTSYMCEVPFLVWLSPDFRRMRPDLRFDLTRPYSTVDLPYTMANLAALRFQGYDDTRSLLSPHFRPRPRRVGELPYETVLDMTRKAKERQRAPSFFGSLTRRLAE